MDATTPEYPSDQWKKAAATLFGRFVWGRITSPEYIGRLQAGSDLRRPGVEAIADSLLEDCERANFGDELRDHTNKKMIGPMIRLAMEANGYEWETDGVPTPNAAVFTEGSRYRRRREVELHVYRSSENYRDFILLPSRVRRDQVPKIAGVRRWNYDGVVLDRARAALVLGIRNIEEAMKQMENGFYRGYQARVMRPG